MDGHGRLKGTIKRRVGDGFICHPPTDVAWWLGARADIRGSRTIYCSRQCVVLSMRRINSLAVSPATAVQASFQFSL
jgi:hypothetical protein